MNWPKAAIARVEFPLHIVEMLGERLFWPIFFPLPGQNVGTVSQITPKSLPSTFIPIHCTLTVLIFEAKYAFSKLLTASFIKS
jgi:hypothetical protein